MRKKKVEKRMTIAQVKKESKEDQAAREAEAAGGLANLFGGT